MGASLVEQFASLPEAERNELLGELSPLEIAALATWRAQARPEQLPPPGGWSYWALIGGRGSGKTRSAAEWVCDRIEGIGPHGEATDFRAKHVGFIGRTSGDVRRVMVEGEALALDTLIATPDGFTAMGDLKVGDRVLGPDGKPTTITWCSPVAAGRPCFGVKFKHGPMVVADANHKWVTSTRAERRRGTTSIKTTAELAADILTPAGLQHAVALAEELDLPDAELPIAPYVLGYWLGDGNRRDGGITTADPEVIARIENEGYRVRRQAHSAGRTAGMYTVIGLKVQLRAIGALGSKHLPAVYLRASAKQRLALLQGLIDSDGAVTERGQVQFDNTNRALCDIVFQLACSLGIRCGGPRMHRPAGTGHADHWRVSFTTTVPVAGLTRKAERITGYRDQRAQHRLIESIEPTASVPVRCIAVAAEHHQYLVTTSLVPTHNSGFIACAERRGMRVMFNPSRAQITVTCTDGHEATITLFSADEPDGLRGPQHDTVWADEFAAWPNKADSMGNTALTNAQAGLRLGDGPGYGRGGQPQGCFTTTPRPIPSVKAIMRDDTGAWAHTHMTTWDNAANLAPGFIEVLQRQYAGTRLALQEFEGILVEDVEGALWSIEWLGQTRVVPGQSRGPGLPPMTMPVLTQRATAVDPSIAFKGQGDECGIVTGGVGIDRRMYVTGDWSISADPDVWARRAVEAYRATSSTVIIAEGNQGYAMVSTVIHNVDPLIPVEMVLAHDGKRARAEPIAQLWNPGQQRASIVGSLPLLEEQLYGWSALEDESPDRLDAMVWLGHWCLDRMYYAPAGFSMRFRNRQVPNPVG